MFKISIFKSSLLVSLIAALIFSSSANAIRKPSTLYHSLQISALIDSEKLSKSQVEELDKISTDFDYSDNFQAALSSLTTRDMTAESQFEIIDALLTFKLSSAKKLQLESLQNIRRLTDEERLRLAVLPRFVSVCQQFRDLGYAPDQFSHLLEALSRVSAEKLYDPRFVPMAKSLMTGTTNRGAIIDLMIALSETDPHNWNHLSKLTNSETTGMSDDRKFWTIGCLGRSPSESWDSLIATSQRLRNPEMDTNDYSYVIAAVTSLRRSWREDQPIFEKTARALGQKLDPKTTWHITELATPFYSDRKSIPYIADFSTRTQGLLDFKDYHSLKCIFSTLSTFEDIGQKRAFAHLLTENILAKKRVITDSDISSLITEASRIVSKATDEGITDILKWVSLTKELTVIEEEITALNKQQIRHLATAFDLESQKRASKGKTRRNLSKQASREHLIADGHYADLKKARKQKSRIEKQIKGLTGGAKVGAEEND